MAESGYAHSFPAVRGIQAGRAFYVAMCPLRIIPKIFVFNEDEVSPELRAQRVLNRARIPEIASYLVDFRDSYVLSALTVSVDARVEFKPFTDTGLSTNIGMLSIPMDAQILINDGQHRRAAIEVAIRENKALGQDNIPVLFFTDAGLKRSQQMFTDLNKYAIRPNTSLTILYDHRDPTSELARYLADNCAAFQGLTEFDKSAISNRSIKLFTLSSIKHGSRALLKKKPREAVLDAERDRARKFWDAVGEEIPDWQRAKARLVPSAELREGFIHAHGIALHALGIVGASLFEQSPTGWRSPLKKLRTIDWARSNSRLWEGRALVNGRVSKTSVNVSLTASLIKKRLGLRLTPEETKLEGSLKR